MSDIYWPSNTAEITDTIRDTIGRNITINVTVSGIPCTASGCGVLDPITNLAVNQFCPVCSGFYWTNTLSGYILNAYVQWGRGEIPIWDTGGRLMDGDCSVQVKYTSANVTAIDNSANFVVDGKILLKESVEYRGVPDINRVLVTLKDVEKEE